VLKLVASIRCRTLIGRLFADCCSAIDKVYAPASPHDDVEPTIDDDSHDDSVKDAEFCPSASDKSIDSAPATESLKRARKPQTGKLRKSGTQILRRSGRAATLKEGAKRWHFT